MPPCLESGDSCFPPTLGEVDSCCSGLSCQLVEGNLGSTFKCAVGALDGICLPLLCGHLLRVCVLVDHPDPSPSQLPSHLDETHATHTHTHTHTLYSAIRKTLRVDIQTPAAPAPNVYISEKIFLNARWGRTSDCMYNSFDRSRSIAAVQPHGFIIFSHILHTVHAHITTQCCSIHCDAQACNGEGDICTPPDEQLDQFDSCCAGFECTQGDGGSYSCTVRTRVALAQLLPFSLFQNKHTHTHAPTLRLNTHTHKSNPQNNGTPPDRSRRQPARSL